MKEQLEKLLKWQPKPLFSSRPIEDSQTGMYYASTNDRVFASVIDTAWTSFLLLPLFSWLDQLFFTGMDASQFLLSLSTAPSVQEKLEIIQNSGAINRILGNNLIQTTILSAIILSLWFYGGTTPGKWLLKMRIVDAKTGAAPSRKQFIKRLLGYIPSALFFMLGFFWISWDKKRQGWHDKIANTVVIKEKKWSHPRKKYQQF